MSTQQPPTPPPPPPPPPSSNQQQSYQAINSNLITSDPFSGTFNPFGTVPPTPPSQPQPQQELFNTTNIQYDRQYHRQQRQQQQQQQQGTAEPFDTTRTLGPHPLATHVFPSHLCDKPAPNAKERRRMLRKMLRRVNDEDYDENDTMMDIDEDSDEEQNEEQNEENDNWNIDRLEKALAYLNQIKAQFWHQPDIYKTFTGILKDYREEIIDTEEVLNCVAGLFKGHISLLIGFNTFLPENIRIEIKQQNDGSVRAGYMKPQGDFQELDIGMANLNIR